MREGSPSGQSFFIFVQFSRKIGQIVCRYPPPPEVSATPLGNPGSATADHFVTYRYLMELSAGSKVKKLLTENLLTCGISTCLSYDEE